MIISALKNNAKCFNKNLHKKGKVSIFAARFKEN